MINNIKQKVVIEESKKKKLDLICKFSNTTLKIIYGGFRKIIRIIKRLYYYIIRKKGLLRLHFIVQNKKVLYETLSMKNKLTLHLL